MARAAAKPPKRLRVPRIWPAAFSAALIFAAFPPLRLGLLSFAGFVPWLIYLREVDGKRAFRSGILFGFLFWLGEFSFVGQFVARWTGDWLLGAVPYLIGCAIASLYFGLFAWLAKLCYRQDLPWCISLVWAGVEVFRSYIVGIAFPYGLIGTTLSTLPPIIQSAHYGTVYFVSAWILLSNVVITELMMGKSYRAMRWYVAAFAAVLVTSLIRFANPLPGEIRTVVAGQTGVDMAFGDQSGTEAKLALAADAIIDEARGADLLVLPEGIVKAGSSLPPPVLFHLDPDLPTVFGGQRGEKPAYQSAFTFDGTWAVADKTRLVIFGEYVPFREHLPFLDSFELPSGDLTPGDGVVTPRVGKFRVGEALCFEALFPDIAYRHALNGANVLTVMSVDDWYMGTNAPEQLRNASVWRAIESGMPVVRAASTGYSCIIDARGEIVAQAPLGESVALPARVRVPDKADLFPLLPVFPALSLASLICLPVYDAIRRRKRSETESEGGEKGIQG